MTEWQPIETAPRDGTEIILYYSDYLGHRLVINGYWDDESRREEEHTWAHSIGSGDADGWMEIPVPTQAIT